MSTRTGWDWVLAGAIVVVALIVARIVQTVVVRFLRRGDKTASFSEVLVGRFIAIGVSLLGLAYALSVLEVQIGPLLGALGIGGLAVALAIQPTLQNLFAGVVLETQRPFRRGDEIETNNLAGVVVDITSRSTVLETLDAQRVHLPNTMVLENAVTNRTANSRRRSSVFVGVAYGTELTAARAALAAAVDGADGVLADPAPSVWSIGFGDSSIDFEVQIWHASADHARRIAIDATMFAIERELAAANITIPFPQRTVWLHAQGDGGGEDTSEGSERAR